MRMLKTSDTPLEENVLIVGVVYQPKKIKKYIRAYVIRKTRGSVVVLENASKRF